MTMSNRALNSPNLETLEDRSTPSSYIWNGDLYVVGGNANDSASVNYEVYSGVGYYHVNDNGAHTWYTASSVWGGDVAFYGYGGNDYFVNYSGLRTYAWGGDGVDTLVGSYNADYLDGQNGTDYIYGYGGNDTLIAGYDWSYNYVNGGTGDDWIYGGYGGDTLVGEAGNDWIYGFDGNDWIYGGTGNDVIYAGWGNDVLMGDAGIDYLYGEGGNDTLYGGGYNSYDNTWDYLHGGAGSDAFDNDWYWNGWNWVQVDTHADYLAGTDYKI